MKIFKNTFISHPFHGYIFNNFVEIFTKASEDRCKQETFSRKKKFSSKNNEKFKKNINSEKLKKIKKNMRKTRVCFALY